MSARTLDVHLDQDELANWRAEPVRFIEQVLIDPETKAPFVLLRAERAFLALAFKTDDAGRLLYPEQVFGAPKKSGKTGFAAMHGLTTTLLFGGAYPEAVTCANDFEQAQGRVFQAMKRIVECSPRLRSEAKITADKITFPWLDVTITALASDYAGAAGGNQNIAIFDELWGYVSERARRLWDELCCPPTRKIACRLTVTYAGFSGESVLLEELYQRGMAQPVVGDDLRAGDGILFFWAHAPIAPWQTESWLTEMRRSLRPNAYARMIENKFVSTESPFIDMAWWDECVDPAVSPRVADRELKIWVGVDASVKRDSTAIVAVTFDRKTQRAALITHKIFQPSPDEPLDFEETVERTLIDLHMRFNLRMAMYDPFQMAASAMRLTKAGVRMEELPQTVPNLTAAASNLYELIKGRNITLYPDGKMRLSVSRAVAQEGARGWKISKDKQTHKIDVVVALAIATLAAVQNQNTYTLPEASDWSYFYGALTSGRMSYTGDDPQPTPYRSLREHPDIMFQTPSRRNS